MCVFMIKGHLNKKKWGTGVFIVAFVGLFFYYNLHESLFYPPQSVHIWRQTNCLSLAQNYYQYGLPLLKPEMHNQFPDNGYSGKSVGEFPIIYYTVAKLWQIFGEHEWIFKLLQNVILFIGLFALYRVLRKVVNNELYALLVSLLIFTSPTLIYFGPNFLPDVPSLSFVFIAWFFCIRFLRERKVANLWLASCMFCLAMLLKVTAAISFIAIGGWILFEILFLKEEEQIFKFRFKQILPFIISTLLVICWYFYANHYNKVHGGHFSFHGIWPIWDMDKAHFDRVIEALENVYFKELFLPLTQYLTVGIWLGLILKIRKLDHISKFLVIVLPIGFLLQLILWFQVLENHDYYMINLYVVFVAIWGIFMRQLAKHKLKWKYITYSVLIVFFTVNVVKCRKHVLDRYQGWMQNDFNRMKALNDIEPYFEQWGIEKEAKVISMNDFSINSSLYYMNRKGYTNFGSDLTKAEAIYDRIRKGAKFMVVTDTTILSQYFLAPFIHEKLGSYQNVFVYDLRNINFQE